MLKIIKDDKMFSTKNKILGAIGGVLTCFLLDKLFYLGFVPGVPEQAVLSLGCGSSAGSPAAR